MNRVYKSALMIITIFLLTFILKNTFALEPTLIQKFKIDPKITSCVLIGTTVDNKMNGFENSKEKHMEIYTKLIDRFEIIISKWNDRGYDTDKLEEDLSTVKDKVDEYQKDYDVLKTKLEELKSLCGDDAYNTKLSEVKTALKELRKDVVDIRVFYQTVIRKDLKDLLKQNLE